MKKYLIPLAVLMMLIISVGGYLYYSNNDETSSSTNQEDQPLVDEEGVRDQFDEVGSAEEPEEDKRKDPQPSSVTKLDSPPVVSTGAGQVESEPVGLGQLTSTTCQSVAGVACYIEFADQSTGEVKKKFESKTTDSQGTAAWDWKGSDVGAGTYNVTAHAGDKVSEPEVIYVK